MIKRIGEWLKYSNQVGIPFPLLLDHQKPSVSLTMLMTSTVFVILGLSSKMLPLLGEINFWEALAWWASCAVLYLNRGAKVSKNGIELSASTKESTDEQEGTKSN